MKIVGVVIVVIAVFSGFVSTTNVKDLEQRRRDDLASRIDESANLIVDAVVELLKKYAVEHSLEPMQLPDMQEKFSVEIIVTFEGMLYLTNGLLQHLTTMVRSGDATIQYNGNLVNIKTNVKFSDLLMNYHYLVTIMGLEPSGELIGKAEGLELAVNLVANLDTYKTTLGGLQVMQAADITLEVDGNGIADEILNAIASLVTPYFEDDVLAFVQEKMTSTLAEALVDFDIREILGH